MSADRARARRQGTAGPGGQGTAGRGAGTAGRRPLVLASVTVLAVAVAVVGAVQAAASGGGDRHRAQRVMAPTDAGAGAAARAQHPDLLLRRNGQEVVDSDWGEVLLDLSTPAKRAQLTVIIGAWIDGCADKGFRAVEPDNLDSWTRSQGMLRQAQALDLASALAGRAHAAGLAIAQKNAAEIGDAGRAAGLDFAVAEECQEYARDDGSPECQSYVDVYGAHVIVVEYARAGFQRACTRFGPALSVVLRDVELTAPGSSGYQFGTC